MSTKIGRNSPCPCGSGRKYKKCCMGMPPFIADKFSVDLFERMRANKDRLAAASEKATASIKVQTADIFGNPVEDPIDACARLETFLQWLEAQVALTLGQKPALFWLCLDRRFPAGLAVEGDTLRRRGMAEQRHHSKTALFHKYGAAEDFAFTVLSDGTFSFDVTDDDVEALFGLIPYFDQISRVPSAFRRAGKGAAIQIHTDGTFYTELDKDTEDLAALYDRRRSTIAQDYASSGGLGSFAMKKASMTKSFAVNSWSTIALIPVTDQEQEYIISGMGRIRNPSFDLYELFLEPLKFLSIFEKNIFAMIGLSVDQLRRCMVAVKRYFFIAWKPASEYTLVTRGTWFIWRKFLEGNITEAYRHVADEEGADPSEAEGVVDRYLALLQGGDPRQFDLLLRRGLRTVYFDKEMVAIDVSVIQQALLNLLIDLEIDDEMRQIKGLDFEKYVARMLEEQVEQIAFPIKPGLKLKRVGENNPFAEVDVYAQIQDILLLIDCKAYSVTRDYLKGEARAIGNRWILVQEWLAETDKRAVRIVETRRGSNFEIPADVKYVIPIVCSAFTEFIWTKDPRFFLSGIEIPRVCTFPELISVLNQRVDMLKAAPFVLRLE